MRGAHIPMTSEAKTDVEACMVALSTGVVRKSTSLSPATFASLWYGVAHVPKDNTRIDHHKEAYMGGSTHNFHHTILYHSASSTTFPHHNTPHHTITPHIHISPHRPTPHPTALPLTSPHHTRVHTHSLDVPFIHGEEVLVSELCQHASGEGEGT